MKKVDRSLQDKDFEAREDDGIIICRCEEITRGEIRKAVYDGMRTASEVKRYLRAGMGLCQGQNCNRLVRNIIAGELGLRPVEVEIQIPRAPARPIPMEVLANDGLK